MALSIINSGLMIYKIIVINLNQSLRIIHWLDIENNNDFNNLFCNNAKMSVSDCKEADRLNNLINATFYTNAISKYELHFVDYFIEYSCYIIPLMITCVSIF